MQTYNCFRCKTSKVPKELKFKRAGVILYFYLNNVKYYYFVIDDKTGNLTDAGGSIKKSENWLRGSLRELKEETYGVFNYCNQDSYEFILNNSYSIYDDNNIIVFQNINVTDPMLYIKKVRASYEKLYSLYENTSDNLETSYLICVNHSDLEQLACGLSPPIPSYLLHIFDVDANKCIDMYIPRKYRGTKCVNFPQANKLYGEIYKPVKNILFSALMQSIL